MKTNVMSIGVKNKDDEVTLIAVNSIDEYVNAAGILLNTKKNDLQDDVFGMAALVLLMCALDAMGGFYNEAGQFSKLKKNLKGVGKGCHIQKLKSANNLSDNDWLSCFDDNNKKYRNHSVHNASLAAGFLIDNESSELVVEEKAGNIYLHLSTLLEKARTLFKNFLSANNLCVGKPADMITRKPSTGATS